MIYQILCSIFPKTIKKLQQESYNFGYSQHQKHDWESRKKIKLIEAEEYQSSGPIISLSNEWLNPIVGDIVVIENEKGLLYGIYDYISNEVLYTTSTPFIFSMQKLEMLNKINPDEICCLFYEGRNHSESFHKRKDCMNSESRGFTHYDDWITKLNANGFFEKYPQFKN